MEENRWQKKWHKAISKTLRKKIIDAELTYGDLANELAKIGAIYKEDNIRVKASKGNFSAAFFIQSLYAMGVKTLDLEEIIKLVQKQEAGNDSRSK